MLCNIHGKFHFQSILIYLIMKINLKVLIWRNCNWNDIFFVYETFFLIYFFLRLFKWSSLNHAVPYHWQYTLLSFRTTREMDVPTFSSYINWPNCLIEHCYVTQSTLFLLHYVPHTVVIYYLPLAISAPSGTYSDELCLRLVSSTLYFSTETKAYWSED